MRAGPGERPSMRRKIEDWLTLAVCFGALLLLGGGAALWRGEGFTHGVRGTLSAMFTGFSWLLAAALIGALIGGGIAAASRNPWKQPAIIGAGVAAALVLITQSV